MNARDVLKAITRKAPDTKLSLAMGKNSNYLSVAKSRKSVPQADTFAMISNVCGYDLLVRERDTGDEIIIDPPDKG